jgi:hypothetical protein
MLSGNISDPVGSQCGQKHTDVLIKLAILVQRCIESVGHDGIMVWGYIHVCREPVCVVRLQSGCHWLACEILQMNDEETAHTEYTRLTSSPRLIAHRIM